MRHAAGYALIGLLLTLVAISCGGGGGGGAPDPRAAVFSDAERRAAADTFVARLDAAGYDAREGAFYFFEVGDCADLIAAGLHCFGNNPSSPYGLYALPRIGNEPIVEAIMPTCGRLPPQLRTGPDDAKCQDYTGAWHLREDEALVFFGRTPPAARYFGFTHYLFDRMIDIGVRRPIFASLGDSVNPANIAVDRSPTTDYAGAFDRDAVVITTADAKTGEAVVQAFLAAGVSESILNTQVIPHELVTMGLGEDADTFTILVRMALFEDTELDTSCRGHSASRSAYIDSMRQELPRGLVFRVTPKVPHEPVVHLTTPPRWDRRRGETQLDLAAALDDLEVAVRDAHPDAALLTAEGKPTGLWGEECLVDDSACLGDNPDAAYLTAVPGRRLVDDDYFILIGVNHEAAGWARYSNASVYLVQDLLGVASLNSASHFPGSAAAYLPGHPMRHLLYAVIVARDCSSFPCEHCMEVPTEFPGVPEESFPVFVFRAYLQPNGLAGPHPDELLMPRVLYVSP